MWLCGDSRLFTLLWITGFEYSSPDDDEKTLSQQTQDMDESDVDLSMWLTLTHKTARVNMDSMPVLWC